MNCNFQTENNRFLRSYSDALAKIPSSEILIHNMAASEASGGHLDQAVATLKGAIKQIGHTPYLSHGLGSLMARKGELEEALPLIDKALDQNPTNLRFILDRASLDIRNGPCREVSVFNFSSSFNSTV